jgi:hypothetical protein
LLVETVGVSLASAKLRGGKFSNMKDAVLEKWYLFISAFSLEFTSVYLASKGISFIGNNILYIHLISYGLLFAGAYFNIKKLSFKIILIGFAINFLVIILNGGQMPVSADAMLKAGLDKNLEVIQNGKIVTHTIINSTTKVSFLGDIFRLSRPYPMPKVYSVGDIIMAIGVFAYIQEIMVKKINLKKS